MLTKSLNPLPPYFQLKPAEMSQLSNNETKTFPIMYINRIPHYQNRHHAVLTQANPN